MPTPDIPQCPDCGGPMQLVYVKRGAMLGCCRYPDCKGIRKISSQQAKEIERMPRVSSFYATHYRTGEEVRAGDRISWAGYPGYVVFVLGVADTPPDIASSDYWAGKDGFMLDVQGAGLVFQPESGEDLDFLARK